MERNFTNENFEEFLRQNADGLRMRPSDKVWKGISRNLNKRRRRFGFLFTVSLLLTGAFSYFLIGQPGSAITTVANTSGNTREPNSANSVQPDHSGSKEATEKAYTSSGSGTQGSSGLAPVISINGGRISSGSSTRGTTASGSLPENNDVAANGNLKDQPFTGTTVDMFADETQARTRTGNFSDRPHQDPMTIESVINSYKYRPRKKIGFQIYFTPTISYRKLGENKSYLRDNSGTNIAPTYLSYFDVNQMVTHKPDFGFEVGLTAKYPLTRNLKLRAGLQFNVSRYDIKAYNASTQLATFRMNGAAADSINRVTNYNNFGGYRSDWLQNLYFQVSAPIGVELTLAGNSKVQMGIATTIQPTYVLGDRSYVLSTDYKNYAEVPDLTRRWNVNTNFETFVAYSTGHLKWQVGPQVRYQLLSSFVSKYPVKENLFDFGLKVGISLNNQ
jgi:hypothetical protein